MLAGRALPELSAPVRVVLSSPECLQQGFLRMNGDGAPAGGGAGRAECTGLADGDGKVDRGRADRNRDCLVCRTDDGVSSKLSRPRIASAFFPLSRCLAR